MKNKERESHDTDRDMKMISFDVMSCLDNNASALHHHPLF